MVLLHALCNFEVCPTHLTLEPKCGAAAPRHGLLTEFTETQEVSPTAQSHWRLLLASCLLTCHEPKHVTYLKLNLECVYIFKVGWSHRRVQFGHCCLSIFIGICKLDKCLVNFFTFENFLKLWDSFYGKRGKYFSQLKKNMIEFEYHNFANSNELTDLVTKYQWSLTSQKEKS